MREITQAWFTVSPVTDCGAALNWEFSAAVGLKAPDISAQYKKELLICPILAH